MSIRQEDLIAYVLGDATRELRRAVDEQLAEDPSLRERLARLRMLLGHLETFRSNHEPPDDLCDRTLKFIDTQENRSIGSSSSKVEHRDRVPDHRDKVHLSRSGVSSMGNGTGNAWDSMVLSLSVAVLCCLILPTILRARFESRRIQCADNLRYLGQGLLTLASLSGDQRFPAVPVEGPSAFAGIYAVRLNDSKLLDSPSRLICVGAPRPVADDLASAPRIPSLSELQNSDLYSQSDWQRWRRTAGGDYAYCLGVMEHDHVVPPRSSGRSRFAILGDAPTISAEREEFTVHGRQGLNLLYEDGHVEFVSTVAWSSSAADHPYRNQDGAHEVGLHIDDASLAPSHFAPLRHDPVGKRPAGTWPAGTWRVPQQAGVK